ncbi:proto-oncogene Mas-like [Gastrophryne carolinensis]
MNLPSNNSVFNLTSNHTTPRPQSDSFAKQLATLTSEITLCLVIVLVCLIGMVGNTIIMFIFCFRVKLNQSTVYILNLALADLLYLIGCCVVILYCLCLLNGVTTDKQVDKAINTLWILLNNFAFNASLFFLGTLSVERCLSVCFPLWYKCRRPSRLSAILCSVIWILALVIMFLENYVNPTNPMDVSIGLSVVFLILTLLMVVSSVVLLIQIQGSSVACRPVKLYIVVIASVVSFLFSMVPARVVKVIYLPTSNMRIMAFILTSLFSAIHSCMNPYIYVIVSRWKRSNFTAQALEMTFREDTRQTSQQTIATAFDETESTESASDRAETFTTGLTKKGSVSPPASPMD